MGETSSMVNRMVLTNLAFRKTRTALSVIAVAVEELLIDDIYAEDNHKRVGDTVEVWHTDFKVVGIVKHGKAARMFVPLKTSQELNSSEGKASIFYVRLDDPAQTDYVASIIQARLP